MYLMKNSKFLSESQKLLHKILPNKYEIDYSSLFSRQLVIDCLIHIGPLDKTILKIGKFAKTMADSQNLQCNHWKLTGIWIALSFTK